MSIIKILAIISSGRKKGHTSKIVSLYKQYLEQISANESDLLNFETIFLSDYSIEYCLGCRKCMDIGEEYCPRKDDLPKIKQKIKEADAVIFASPVYVGDVSSLMKSLIDRLAYICHRQEFYDKCCLIVATTNATSLKRTIHTIGAATYSWGFKTIGTKGFKTSSSNDSRQTLNERYGRDIYKISKKFYFGIKNKSYLHPSLISLISFKIQQKYRANPELSSSIDYNFWSQKGWTDPNVSFYINHNTKFPKIIFAVFLSKIISLIF
ncbi:MAG: flavodoxin family protein [Candidatus Thorarchaeota archaeon]